LSLVGKHYHPIDISKNTQLTKLILEFHGTYDNPINLSKNIQLNYLKIYMYKKYNHKIDLSKLSELTYLDMCITEYEHPIDLSGNPNLRTKYIFDPLNLLAMLYGHANIIWLIDNTISNFYRKIK